MTNHKKNKNKNKIKSCNLENRPQKNFVIQQPVREKNAKFDYFRRNTCLFTKSSCKKMTYFGDQSRKSSVFAGFRKNNRIFMLSI